MIRGFLSGVIWGTVVSALGLGAASQLTELPAARIAADASAVPRAKPAPAIGRELEPNAMPPADPAVAAPAVDPASGSEAPASLSASDPEYAPNPDPAPDAAPDPDASADTGPVTGTLDPPAGSEFAKPLPDLDPVIPAIDQAPAPEAAAVAPLTAPATDVATVTDAPSVAPRTGLDAPEPLEAPELSLDQAALGLAEDDAKLALALPVQPALPGADTAPIPVQDPAPPAKPEPDEELLTPLPDSLAPPENPAEPSVQFTPDPVLLPPTGTESGPQVEPVGTPPATLVPTPSLDGTVDGVTTGRLPRIGDAPLQPAAEAAAEPDPAIAPEDEAEQPPLQRYARPFENPDAKPLFAIILIDTGGADVDRSTLAALPFAVTFALDPSAPNVAEAAGIYRKAGQEVIMVATGIPAGATASDLEVTFQSNAAALPEAVAVIDTEYGAFQADRPLATQVVPILKAQGRGLISWDRGLNAADQVARREGLASGMVFRKLDGKGENTAAVRRALDRAAFKAAQDGRVMVIGQTLPDTVEALTEWALEGRAASVALAPVSAVLTAE